jgi:hypothetical protein
MPNATVGEWLCNNLRVIPVNDVAHAIFAKNIHRVTMNLQNALYFVHPNNIFLSVI